ncbi:PAS domain-containing protein [Amphritea sp. 1_MG-2023]|uniref:PAS domain-containing protein n=1 Tax=Amphritea sp. 1_MG-2023 TaxID=3062670 RepID=UPI0026E1A059|nr:PAS domain-containing protein [Amphritea sp. 1_MG-2023]MDO6564978.1 PAS domain-containing protein [Amphritea sp. 1_MG-2023]
MMTVLNLFRRPKRALPALTEVLDSLADAVLVFNGQLDIHYVNAYWKTLTGYSQKESIDSCFSDYIHPEDHRNWMTFSQRASQERLSQCLWFRLIRKDGEVRWCEIRLQSLHTDQPSPLTATLCDITPQVRSDEIKKANHRSLSGLVNRLPGMLYRGRNDTRWTMEYVSEGCLGLTGFSREQLLNQTQLSIGALIHPNDAGRVWETVQHALQQQQCFELYYSLLHADGHYRQVYEKGQGIYSSTGAVLGIEGIILNLNTTE